jgi:hypothetical protein
MKYLKIFIILLLLSVPLHSQTRRDSIKTAIGMLEEGLKNKNIELIRKTFSDNISISTSMGTGANSLLEAILQNVNFEAIELLPDTLYWDNNNLCANVKFMSKQNKPQLSMIAFDNENKILFIDYFDRLFGQSRYNESSLVAVIPFTVEDHSVVLSLKLNNSDRPLSFLLDSGADGMAIRKSLADSLGIKSDFAQNAGIVGGDTQINISTGNTVHLTDSLSLTNQNMAIFDKTHGNLDGIIGLNLIKRYITKIDFDNQKISLYSFGDFHYDDAGITIPIKMVRNLVVVPSQLNLMGTEWVDAHFLFDMGANYKLIAFYDFVKRNRLLLTGFQAESIGNTVSMGHTTLVYHGKAKELNIGGIIEKDMPITLQATSLNNTPQNNGVDGSLGVQLWSEYNLTIDLLRKEIQLIPRK